MANWLWRTGIWRNGLWQNVVFPTFSVRNTYNKNLILPVCRSCSWFDIQKHKTRIWHSNLNDNHQSQSLGPHKEHHSMQIGSDLLYSPDDALDSKNKNIIIIKVFEYFTLLFFTIVKSGSQYTGGHNS